MPGAGMSQAVGLKTRTNPGGPDASGVGWVFQQGLGYEERMFRIVADHASAEEKAMPPRAGQ